MGQLQQIEQDLVDLGYQILAVSPDTPSKLSAWAQKAENEGYRYTLLSDSSAEGAKGFGIAFRVSDKTYKAYKDRFNLDLEEQSGQKHRVLPVPAVFLIKDGTILFEYVNPDYRVRLHPDILLAAAAVHAR